ncbi:hypothetical protein Pyrde_1943 [Pyrodictium delaneyi]|uniref:Type I phosphodiesterase/nucleotide pyrophosphatase n=1 Tax=Pyrodictium delaneyi TaxID=1273541 RepID=A0A0P0N4Z4_9CREN|nr:alkaline phosphatase family protein [Pyrodictium delaneyi]ALL01986.1 hypothetical protein Pyrde_1943 [Pyrodictium delaneyi]
MNGQTLRNTIVIGLDGMPLSIFDLVFENGVMPFTRSVWSRLVVSESNVFVPLTAPSWVSISTGVNPGKHGVFDFFYVDVDHSELRPVTKAMVERPLVNEITATSGLESIVLGVPFAYPPFVRSNNVVVSGWLTPRLRAWPPGEEEIARRFGVAEGPPSPGDLEGYVDSIVEGLERKAELIEYYYTRRRWRLFYFMLPEPDWVFHYLYGDILEGSRRGRRALRVFERIDRVLRLVFENLPDNSFVVLCSDHGFAVARRAVNGNVLLERLGLLKRRESGLSLRSRLLLSVARLLPSWLKSRLKYSSLAFLVRKVGAAEPFMMSSLPVDYSSSMAFMTTSYNVYVNPRLGREVRQRVRSTVLEAFRRYSDMLSVVEYGDRFFWGPYVGRAPDVVVIPRDGFNVTTKLMYRRVVEDGRWYVHSSRGMLALYTNDGDVGVRLPGDRLPSTADIVPTVLAFLGLPLDPEFDGEPLLEGVDPGRLGRRSYRVIARIGKRLARGL